MPANLDPRVSLATALESQPGVYALLLGSGVSTGAGIPTGWGVVEALVRRAAVAAGDEPGANFNAEEWWAANGEGDLGYSAVVAALGLTRAARRGLLAEFFEPTDEEREDGLKVPGNAHKAIAALVRKGVIRVIVTTNFDRLMESALEAEGVSPQVIDTAGKASGMEPMQHARCTVIKLHGDYASQDLRNTVDELAAYPPPLKRLLDRVLSEYGLIVSGWSGDWDTALVSAIAASANRRYPLYWVARSAPGTIAKQLTSRSGAQIIEGQTADEFFPELLSRVEALQSMSDTPASEAQLIARVKRALPDPIRHIELRDLFEERLDLLRSDLREWPLTAAGRELADVEAAYRRMATYGVTLARSLAIGIQLDRDESHTELWVHVIEQALRARQFPQGPFQQWLDRLQHLPALMLLTTGVGAALAAGHEDVVVQLLGKPHWNDVIRSRSPLPAFGALRLHAVLDGEQINQFPSYPNQWLYPGSHFLREVVNPILVGVAGDQSEADLLFKRTEFRFALATVFLREPEVIRSAATGGEFLLDQPNLSESAAEGWVQDFQRNGSPDAWGRGTKLSVEEFDAGLTSLTERLASITRW